MEAAVAAWPEDEASVTADGYEMALQDFPDDTEAERTAMLMKDMAHMLKVFARVCDAPEEVADHQSRYIRAVKGRLLAAPIPDSAEKIAAAAVPAQVSASV